MSKEVIKTQTAVLARPAFVAPGDVRGTEDVSREDLQMPRLALAQALSPELDPSSPRWIEGLKFGDAFNNLTGEVYGTGSLEVVIVRAERPRYVEFNPRESGGGIKNYNVPSGDPRTQFGPNGEKPAATKFMEYVALLGEEREPIALSFKGSGLKVARQLNGLIKFLGAKLGRVPSFTFRFSLTPTVESNAKGKYAVFSVRPAGTVDESTFTFTSNVFESIKDKDIVIEREADAAPEEDVPF